MEQIEESFAGIGTSQQYLERTSHVLALISSGLGVALATTQELHTLEHIHFSRLGAGRVLAVVITKAGTVLDRVLTLDRDLTMAELDTAARFLNENFHGWSIERIRVELARRMEEERSEYDRLMQSVEELYRKGALATESGAAPIIFVEGVANLLAGETDREHLRTMLHALEAKERLIELLNAYVDARQRTVRVVVGLEEAIPELKDFVLIGAHSAAGSGKSGYGRRHRSNPHPVSGNYQRSVLHRTAFRQDFPAAAIRAAWRRRRNSPTAGAAPAIGIESEDMRRIMVETRHARAEAGCRRTGTMMLTAAEAGVNDGDEAKEPLIPVETATVPKEEYDRLKAERDLLFDRAGAAAGGRSRIPANAKRRERTEFRDLRRLQCRGTVSPGAGQFPAGAQSQPDRRSSCAHGVELIVKQMEEALRSLNVQPVETVGATFDPRVHEALEMVERNDLPDHQVFEEVRRGYRIRDRLLRPALVRVASNSQQKEA